MGEEEYQQALEIQSDSVYNKNFLKAVFLNRDKDVDELIIRYISNGCNKGICSYDRLRLYFCFKNDLLTRLRLNKRLETLCKHKILRKDKFESILYYEVIE